jgi:SAM-dependent methyltransferase
MLPFVKLLPLVWKLNEVWHEEGISGVLLRIQRYANRSSKPDAFDLAHGTETSVMVDMWHLDVGGPNVRTAVKYQPVNPDVLKLAFQAIPDGALRFPFIDVGCGKGRALILAHEAGFKRLVGVDFSKELLETAKKNINTCKVTADLHCCDAEAFRFPQEPCVVYFYNPFGTKLISRVASRIPSMSYIVYANPRHRSAFSQFASLLDRPFLFVGHRGHEVSSVH